MRLGSYSTIDCPTDKLDEAYEFLKERFDLIGGNVRKIYNDHDFGPYPSFEVDYPDELEYVDDDPWLEEGEEISDEDNALIEQKDNWLKEANKIEDEYSKKFADYL